MDLSRLSTAEKIIIVGAVIALISTFLAWYGTPEIFGIAGVGISISLWSGHGFAAFLMLAGSAVAIALILLRMFEVFDLADQGVPEPLVVLISAVVTGLGALWGLLDAGGASRKYGMWIGLVGMIIFVIGAVMKFQEER